ncbi:hypothetical protein I3843_16G114900 [Carya illinoinensis]|nr:hypothetical protein I3843_16G114900 [Carya illinoinensis]
MASTNFHRHHLPSVHLHISALRFPSDSGTSDWATLYSILFLASSTPTVCLIFPKIRTSLVTIVQLQKHVNYLSILVISGLQSLLNSYGLIIYKHKSPSHPKLPPGRRGWPIISETLEYDKACKIGEPEKFILDRMSNYSTDVFQTSLFGENLLVFCGASGNKLMFSSANKHVTPRWPRSISAALNFPSDRGFQALQHFLPIMDSMAKEHLEIAWSPYNEVKVLPLTKEYTIAVTCWVFINIKDLEHINRFANLFGLLTKGTTFSRAVREGKFLHEEFLAIIRERKMELLEKKGPTKEDLLSHMLLMINHENDKGMKDKTNGDSNLCKGPGELLSWEDIQKLKYSWNVICEVMREVTTEFTYTGSTIPKGWKTVASTQKNPKYFPNPEKFDPSRFEGSGLAPYTFVPFGRGPHMFIGKEYSRLEILTFIHNVVTKYKWEKVNPSEKIIFKPVPSLVNGLLVCLEPLIKN